MKKFSNVVSLGFSCYVAKDLERMGYRQSSYPFDWVISSFPDVVRLIENGFEENLKLENMEQDAVHGNCYHDRGTGLDYYHDFFPDAGTIQQQHDDVLSKYTRRILRFFRTGKSPTLYVRLIRNQDDFRWTATHAQEIEQVIQKLNPASEVVYIVLEDAEFSEENHNLAVYLAKDLYHPIKTSNGLAALIRHSVAISSWRVWVNRMRYLKKQIVRKLR